MQVDAKTKVHELCERYPYMLDWLVTYNPAFKKLKNPVLYQSVARAASLEAAASLADVPLDTFLGDIRKTIAQHEIGTQETAGKEPQLTEEARAERQKVLKKIIHELHEGAPVEKVKARFDKLVRDVDAAEVATMEQAIIAEGVPVEEVQRLCDVHVTETLDLLYRYPFGDDGLLHGCHFCSIHITDQLVEPGLNLLHRRSLVELVDDLLEYLLAFRPSLLRKLGLLARGLLSPNLMLGNGLSDVV